MEQKRSFSVLLNKLFNLLQVIFQILGLQCFTFSRISLNKHHSIINFFVMTLRLIVNVILIIYFQRDMRKRSGITNVLMKVVQLVMDCGIVLLISISVITAYFSTKKIKKFYINCNEFVNLINQNLSTPVDMPNFIKSVFLRFLAVTIASAGLIFVAGDFGKSGTFFFLSCIPVLHLIMIIFHFTFFVDLINHSLSALSKSINDLCSDEQQLMFHRSIMLNEVRNSNDTFEVVRKLKVVRCAYNKLHESASLINETFGLTIVFLLIIIVISTTISGYKILMCILEGEIVNILHMHCKFT